MDPLSILYRLAASVPPPLFHTVKYAGVLAPASPWRSRIAPPAGADPTETRPEPTHGKPKRKGTYRPWAELLLRTFAVDVLECPRCQRHACSGADTSPMWMKDVAGGRAPQSRCLSPASVALVAVLLAGPAVCTDARTVDEVLSDVAAATRARLNRSFEAAKVPYPPPRAALLAFKTEMRVELWAETAHGPRCVRDYTILGASGVVGPKMRRGDLQVPEGIYATTWLNPNSAGYLGIKLDYPNAFDRQAAKRDGRRDPGGDIYIHGHWYSTGCLAMGNEAIEDLFVLAHDTGLSRVTVIIAPWDLRSTPPPKFARPWTDELYALLVRRLKRYH